MARRQPALVDAYQVTTLYLAVAVTANLDDEGGDGYNGNEQDGDENEHEVPFKGGGMPGTEATLLVYDPLS